MKTTATNSTPSKNKHIHDSTSRVYLEKNIPFPVK